MREGEGDTERDAREVTVGPGKSLDTDRPLLRLSEVASGAYQLTILESVCGRSGRFSWATFRIRERMLGDIRSLAQMIEWVIRTAANALHQ
jgi:hypothetical protein